MSVMKNIDTINGLIRTLLALGVVGGLGYAGWLGYSTYEAKQNLGKDLADAKYELIDAQNNLQKANESLADRDRQIASKNLLLQAKDEKISELDDTINQLNEDLKEKEKQIIALQLLKVDHRIAQMKVLEQGVDEEKQEVFTLVEFQEVNDEGQPIDQPKRFRLRGDTVYVECWIVKFDDKYIEQADLDRATSLCLFKGIHGDLDSPNAAQPLEEIGVVPNAYKGSQSDFEKKIWADFWNIANDPQRAETLGIRAVHGQANFTKVRKGKVYRLQLRASDGLTTLPAENDTRRRAANPAG